uniref:WH1 domain-containing protein n=1 Tax=Strigamia maritima TaxID=126957 RepID=T1JGN4_STRMM
MSEGSGKDDGNYLVRVSAQVMTRDESTGLWVPIRGGGLSNVSVRKRPILTEDEAKHEYLIFGKRISDHQVVLSCTIKRDFEYNKVMPTFHHWRTGDKKFGLTFQTAADARAFDKGVKQAVEDVLDGLTDSSFLHASDVGEDDVFMTLELPVERVDSRSSSGSSNGNNSCGLTYPPSLVYPEAPPYSSPFTHPHANHHHLHRMHYISRPQRTSPGTPNGNGSGSGNSKEMTLDDVWVKNDALRTGSGTGTGPGMIGGDDKIEIIAGEQFSYVQFAREPRPTAHEYSYPMIDVVKSSAHDKSKSQTPPQMAQHGFEAKPPLLPTKKRGAPKKVKNLLRERVRCRHCHEMFSLDENERGRCEYAPDHARTCVNAVTCIRCAQCMLYHCMSDAEGDFAHHPCECGDSADTKCGKRWFGLVLLSLLVPCLWCYLPLWACHKCGASCGVCGGRHEAS